MYIDQMFNRRIRIEGKLTDTQGYSLYVYDVDTGEPITNIQRVTVWMEVNRRTMAEIVYLECDDTGHVTGKVHGRPSVRVIRIPDVELAVTSFEVQ